jgi:hypothetical protein
MSNNLTNEEKAEIYDSCVRQGDAIHYKINKLKSQYFGEMPLDKQQELAKYEMELRTLQHKLESLFA